MRIVRSSALLILAVAMSGAAAAEETEKRGAPAGEPKVEPFSDDATVWPNRACFRASEPWLLENHERIRQMRPRVLVLNFANDADMASVRKQTEGFIKAIGESSRYHGYKNPDAPAFLRYEAVQYVDLRDEHPPENMAKRNSSRYPKKKDGGNDFSFDYSALYGDEFAKHYNFKDPKDPDRYLNLHELIRRGLVHELWFYAVHVYEDGWPAFEVAELKQYYDEKLRPIEGRHGASGNGGEDDTLPWSGHSFKVYFFNPHRGVGCQLENFAHGLEGVSNHDAIKYHTPYFREFAELNLDQRFGLPFNSLYAMPYDKTGDDAPVSYPTKESMKIVWRGKTYNVEDYINMGGNAHWPPGGRQQYDLSSPATVHTTLENYRLRNGPDGRDKVTDFNIELVSRYKDVASDCMGRWLVYWHQSMPGLDNKCVDNDGKPMKNWWVYMFY